MSGLEAVAILGLACNVMQVISFSHEAISNWRRIYDGSNDDGMASTASSLNDSSSSLQNFLVRLQPATADEISLIELARKCSEASERVRAVVEKYKVTGKKGKRFRSVLLTAKKTWNKGKLDKVESDLNGCKDALETRILVRLW